MAPPDEKRGAEKYKNMSLEELRSECKTRGIEFNEGLSVDELISLLIEDDKKPTDWGVVYTRLLNAGLRYDEIPERTFPQIKAILGEWANIISLRVPFGLFGSVSDNTVPEQPADKPPKVSQFAAFASMFDAIK